MSKTRAHPRRLQRRRPEHTGYGDTSCLSGSTASFCATTLLHRSATLLLFLLWMIFLCGDTHCFNRSTATCVTWLIGMCVWRDSFIRVTWLIGMRDMTHLYVWHDSLVCVTRLIYTCDMTHWYVWHDSFIRVTWVMRMCDLTQSYVWHDAFIRVT